MSLFSKPRAFFSRAIHSTLLVILLLGSAPVATHAASFDGVDYEDAAIEADATIDYAQAFALLRDEARDDLGIPSSSFFADERIFPIQGQSWVECGLGCGCGTHGGNHAGQDFGTRGANPPVVSVATGQIVSAGWDEGYGNLVAIDHGDGVVSRYAHLDELWVSAGQPVAAGQQIGRVGTTGFAFGTHLHLELIIDGTAVDPLVYLP
jgi:murein DD-endopeptidase MepM/ murein hydrolase activator NlpD